MVLVYIYLLLATVRSLILTRLSPNPCLKRINLCLTRFNKKNDYNYSCSRDINLRPEYLRPAHERCSLRITQLL